jgi:LacI family transcriptional regulator
MPRSSGNATTRASGRPDGRSPTIIDVAERAGTSKSTVSNVLQGKVHVDERTRARVLDAIADLGYRTNMAARHLRQRPRVLGVIVGDLRNPFHAELATQIERCASAAEHTILLATTNALPEQEAQRVEALVEHRVAAVLFLAFSGEESVLRAFPTDIPRLFVSFRAPGGTSIAVDEEEGARLAIEHLHALGHERIAYVSTVLEHEPRTDANRFAGYARAMESYGLDPHGVPGVRLAGNGDATPGEVRAQLTELLTRPDRPTAVFATSDFTAIEVMEAADAVGLEIPGDVSIVGFDDIELAGLSRIALTTIAQPMGELADRAVQRALADPQPRRSRNVLLPPRLVVRGSTGPAPKRARRGPASRAADAG